MLHAASQNLPTFIRLLHLRSVTIGVKTSDIVDSSDLYALLDRLYIPHAASRVEIVALKFEEDDYDMHVAASGYDGIISPATSLGTELEHHLPSGASPSELSIVYVVEWPGSWPSPQGTRQAHPTPIYDILNMVEDRLRSDSTTFKEGRLSVKVAFAEYREWDAVRVILRY